MSYLLFAWIATCGYGFFIVISKLTSKHAISNPWLLNYLLTFCVLAFTLPIALSKGVSVPTHWTDIALAALCYALYFVFNTLALYRIDVTVMSPLYNFRGAFSVLLGGLVLGEVLNAEQIILAGSIIIFGFFVSIDEELKLNSFFKPGVLLAVISMGFLSLTSLFINRAIDQEGYWNTTLWMYILMQALLLLSAPLFFKDLLKLSRKPVVSTAMAALAFVIGNLAANRAYSENISVSSVIISLPASMVIAILFSRFAPQLLEKHTLKVYAIRFGATALMIAAALRLSL